MLCFAWPNDTLANIQWRPEVGGNPALEFILRSCLCLWVAEELAESINLEKKVRETTRQIRFQNMAILFWRKEGRELQRGLISCHNLFCCKQFFVPASRTPQRVPWTQSKSQILSTAVLSVSRDKSSRLGSLWDRSRTMAVMNQLCRACELNLSQFPLSPGESPLAKLSFTE